MDDEGRFWIEIEPGSRQHALPEQGTTAIGRLARNDIALTHDLSVSARHAELDWVDGQLRLVPLSITAKTLLDGAEVDGPTLITKGQVITIGDSRLTVRAGALASQTAASQSTVIGRDPHDAGLVLDHPTVSRRHALLETSPAAMRLSDLGSTNGTFVDGQPIGGQPVSLRDGQRVDIGPFAFVTRQGQLIPAVLAADVPLLEARALTYVVNDRTTGQPLTLLENVSLAIPPGSFTCVIGESGSGKSTLIKQLSGRVATQHGSVVVRGLDIVQHFEALKQDLAYVPQDDLLHEDLTLEQALGYCARLRLPTDQTAESIARIVDDAMAAVDLSARAATRIADLSGGQKKRASLACELLTRPSILFLDEVTSGLDEATDREVMRLLQRLARDGVTILCVTHTLANIEATADRLIVMAKGGLVTFAGPPAEALSDFGISRLGEVFDRLGEPAVLTAARSRNAATAASVQTISQGDQPRPEVNRMSVGERIRQLGVLVPRNLRLKLADRRGLILAGVQASVIGGLLGYAFSDFGEGGQVLQSQLSLLMLLGMASLWIGCNAASQDIVGERLIFERERDANLSTVAFVLSKAIVTGAYTVLQLLVVMLLLWVGAQEVPGGLGDQMPLIAMGGIVGVAIGLAISAWCTTRDQANIVVPLALIPQLILAGMLVPALPEFGKTVSELGVSAYWITEGLKANFIEAAGTISQIDLATGRPAALVGEDIGGAWRALMLHGAAFLAVAVFGARRRQ